MFVSCLTIVSSLWYLELLNVSLCELSLSLPLSYSLSLCLLQLRLIINLEVRPNQIVVYVFIESVEFAIAQFKVNSTRSWNSSI